MLCPQDLAEVCKRDSTERAEDVDRLVGLGSSRWAPKRCISEQLFKNKMQLLLHFIAFYCIYAILWPMDVVFAPQRQRRAGDALQGGQGGGQDGALCLHGTLGLMGEHEINTSV